MIISTAINAINIYLLMKKSLFIGMYGQPNTALCSQ